MQRSLIALLTLILLAACQTAPGTPTPTGPTATLSFADDMATARADALATYQSVTRTPTSTPGPSLPVTIRPSSTVAPTPLPTPTPSLPVAEGGPLPDGALGRLGIGLIRTASLSPDGRYMAVGTTAGAYMYRTADFARIWARTTEQPVQGVVWSPDGRFIAVWPVDEHSSAVLAAATGVQQMHIEHSTAILSADWSPDSTRLVVGWGGGDRYSDPNALVIDPTITVWDVITATQVFTAQAHADNTNYALPVRDVAWSADDRVIAGTLLRYTENSDGNLALEILIAVWDASSGEVLHFMEHPFAQYLAFSPDGSLLATWSGDTGTDAPRGSGEVRVWTVASGELMYALDNGGFVYAVAWTPDGRFLASGTWGQQPVSSYATTHIWDIGTGELLHTISANATGSTNALSWSPDGSSIAGGSWSSNNTGGVYLWDVSRETVAFSRLDHGAPIDSLSWLPDSSAFISVSEDLIALQSADSGEPLLRLPSGGKCFGGNVSFVSDSDPGILRVASSCLDATYRILATSGAYQFQPVSTQSDLELPENPISMESKDSPDGHLRASVEAYDESVYDETPPRTTVTVTERSSGAILYRFEGPPANGVVIIWSPDSTLLALGGGLDYRYMGDDLVSGWEENAMMVWDIITGQLLHRFLGHTGRVLSLAFSPDGSILASGSADGTVILWDVSR